MTMLVNVTDADFNALTNHDIIKHFLIRCTEEMGMTPLPHTLTIEHFPIIGGKGDYGISGMLILIESHISIHTWPEKNYARIEISSCRDFSEIDAVKVIKSFFGGEVKWKAIKWF